MQSVQLSIPTPCHQNWDKMTPTEQGRFCTACAKQVIDFTAMSDGEVLNYFVNKKDENVCGRTLPNQLNRILEAPKPIVPTKLWYWKYAAAAGLLFFTKADNLLAQSITPYTPQQMNAANNALQSKVGEIAVSVTKVISGKITDKNGKEIPFASVKIKGTPNGVSADANGEYSIKVNCTKDILQISSAGFEPKEIDLKNCTSYDINLIKGKYSVEGEVVVGYVGMMNVTSEVSLIKIQRNVAVINVKDSATQKTISDVTLYFKEDDDDEFNNVLLKNGVYKIKHIKKDEIYTIQASKEGYISKAIEISNENFNSRKGVFEIYLEKKIEPLKGLNIQQINSLAISTNDTTRRRTIGKIKCVNRNDTPLLVIDGELVTLENINSVSPADVENVTILKDAKATVIYGSAGINGVIIITTKKQKIKKDTLPTPNYKLMDEVIVNYNPIKGKISYSTTTCTSKVTMGAIISGMTITTTHTDTIKQKIQNFFSPIKTYPNPVKKGEMLTLSFPNKNKFYTVQIINAVGLIVLQNKRQDGFVSTEASVKNITQQVPIANSWSSGYYFINILNEQGKPIAKSSFLVL